VSVVEEICGGGVAGAEERTGVLQLLVRSAQEFLSAI
jgi:hypothetical protein